MCIQTIFQTALNWFEMFQLSLSTISVSVTFHSWILGLIFNQCNIFTEPVYLDMVDGFLFQLTGPYHRYYMSFSSSVWDIKIRVGAAFSRGEVWPSRCAHQILLDTLNDLETWFYVDSPSCDMGYPLCTPFQIVCIFQLIPPIVFHKVATLWYPTVQYGIW